jgi:LEA14-like dessication related protein
MRHAWILLPLLFGCATLKTLTVSRPTVSFREARVDRVDFQEAEVTLVYDVQNPNPVDIRLSNVSYALDVDGHPLAAGTPPQGFSFPPGASQLQFPVKLVWLQVLPAVQALATTDVVHYRASGTAGIETPLGPLVLDLAHEGTIPTPKLPQVAIEAPRLTSLSPLGARLVLPLRVANPNAFAMPLAGLAGEVRIAGEPVAHLALPPQGMVQAHADRTVVAPLDLSFLTAGVAAAKALQSGEADVVIDGSLSLGLATLPLHVSQRVVLQRQ